MNWFKKISQNSVQSEYNIGTPNINVKPLEPLVQEVINELTMKSPNLFYNISDVNIDMGGQNALGWVSNTTANTINLNMARIKSDIKSQTGVSDENSDEYKVYLKKAIASVLMHELGHVEDYDPVSGSFPGGEAAAEQFERNIAL